MISISFYLILDVMAKEDSGLRVHKLFLLNS
jgi:hypothetical protein